MPSWWGGETGWIVAGLGAWGKRKLQRISSSSWIMLPVANCVCGLNGERRLLDAANLVSIQFREGKALLFELPRIPRLLSSYPIPRRRDSLPLRGASEVRRSGSARELQVSKTPRSESNGGKERPDTRRRGYRNVLTQRAQRTQSQPDGLSAGIGLTRSSRRDGCCFPLFRLFPIMPSDMCRGVQTGRLSGTICFRCGESRSFGGLEVPGNSKSPKLPEAKAMAGKSGPPGGRSLPDRRKRGLLDATNLARIQFRECKALLSKILQ